MNYNFRVLLVYPNGMLLNPPPVAYGIFTGLLKRAGYKVELFDGTLYPNKSYYHYEVKNKNLNVRPFSYEGTDLKLKTTNEQNDFKLLVDEFKPNLILVSMLETVYKKAILLLDVLKNYDIPVMAGGVLPTHDPLSCLKLGAIDMVCMGEGNECILHVCEKLQKGEDYRSAPNLAYLKDGKLHKNSFADPTNLDEEPIPDYDLFDNSRFLRPMAGKVYNMIPIETNRGCPYKCTFCNSPSALQQYQKESTGNFLRKKTKDRLKKEIKHLVSRYNGQYIYFTSDTFMLFNDKEFDEFIELYGDIKVPFYMQTRPETVRADRMKKLKEVGLRRMSMGLEHGNFEFRTMLLKKPFKDELFIKTSEIIADCGIQLTVNNIIGFPEETRELIFDTITLNSKLIFDTNNCTFFQPFKGTELHELCVKKGYIDKDHYSDLDGEPILKNQPISHDELRGLKRTFALYTRLEKKHWPQIKIAEQFNEEGDKAFSELQAIFRDKFYNEKEEWAN